jgi:hypothetical protein
MYNFLSHFCNFHSYRSYGKLPDNIQKLRIFAMFVIKKSVDTSGPFSLEARLDKWTPRVSVHTLYRTCERVAGK